MSILSSCDSSSLSSATEPGDSVTVWLKKIRDERDPNAVEKLWKRYFHRMVAVARSRLSGKYRVHYDDEDAALSAFKSVFKRIENNDERLEMKRDALWSFMVTVTIRKVFDQVAYQNREKRRPKNGTTLSIGDGDRIANLGSISQGPDTVVEFEDFVANLIDVLPKQDFKLIVVWKLEGFTNLEIAQRLDRSVSSIERKLKAIRAIWALRIEQMDSGNEYEL